MKNLAATATGVAGILFGCSGAFAQSGPASEPARILAEPPTGDSFQIVVYMLVLFAIVAAGIYVLKRGRIGGFQSGAARKLQISETRALGNRQFLVVVEYESARMLLGVSPGKIDYLSPLDRSPDFASALDAQAQPQAQEAAK